jgi:hypothetical protein
MVMLIPVPSAVAAADIVAESPSLATAVILVPAGIPVPEIAAPTSPAVNCAVSDCTVVPEMLQGFVPCRVGELESTAAVPVCETNVVPAGIAAPVIGIPTSAGVKGPPLASSRFFVPENVRLAVDDVAVGWLFKVAMVEPFTVRIVVPAGIPVPVTVPPTSAWLNAAEAEYTSF